MARFARRAGARPQAWTLATPPADDLFSLALDNRVEGCVRETFGAALAGWQAKRAADPALRRAFARIARDEARHAALAWSIAAWVEPRLARDACAALQVATGAAVAELLKQPAQLSERARQRLGLPDATAHTRLVQGLAPLWRT